MIKGCVVTDLFYIILKFFAFRHTWFNAGLLKIKQIFFKKIIKIKIKKK